MGGHGRRRMDHAGDAGDAGYWRSCASDQGE